MAGRARRPRFLALLTALAALAALPGCSGNPSQFSNPSNLSNPSNAANPANPSNAPSPLPPGYRPNVTGYRSTPREIEERGEELDVIMGVVEGEVITKRRLLREVGGLGAGQDPETLDRQLRMALLSRAKLLVFVKEALRNDVSVRDQYLDQAVEARLKESTKQAAEREGRPVSVDEYLADSGITLDEFRELVRESLQYQAYVLKLVKGLGGPTRPQVDMDVSPAEVRRIYWAHPGAFDEKTGARFAVFQIQVEKYLVGDVGFLDAEEKAIEDADAMAALLEQGVEPAEVARRYGLEEGSDWRASPEEKFVPEGGDIVRFLGEEASPWLFDPSRKPLDTEVFPDANGPLVVTLLERKAGRRIPYDEAYEKIVQMVRLVREKRIVEQRLIEILSTRNVVQPPELSAEMLRQAREQIANIDSDPIYAAARFR